MSADDPAPKQPSTRVALQARVLYMNIDRTLATWTRTSLALIVLGIGLDRYGLLLTRAHLEHVGTRLAPNPLSSLTGILLIAVGMFIAITTAIRHQLYRARWNKTYGHDPRFGPWLSFTFAVMVAIFGALVLAILLALLR